MTGHTGFKGTWLSLWLHALGADVAGFSLGPPTQPSLFEQCLLSDKIRSREGDVRNLEQLKDFVVSEQPEIVFHLASQPLVHASYRDPIQTFETNIIGTANILEAIRCAGESVRVCQMITSDKCYGDAKSDQPYVETDPMGGKDPYSASKGAAELVIASYRNSFFSEISVSSVRAGNVLGGGDWGEDRIVPDCIRALSRGETIQVRNPKAVRPWQYVLDALSGYLSLAEHQAGGSTLYADAWNFGPDLGTEITVETLTEKLIAYWGGGEWTPMKNKTGFREAPFLELDSTKARNILDWRPVYGIDETLEQTTLWYRKAYETQNFDAFSFSMEQIQRYVKTAAERRLPWTLHPKALR